MSNFIGWYLLIIGIFTTVAGGALLASVLFYLSSKLLGCTTYYSIKRLRRTYSVHVLYYWLQRLEKEGTHCFEKAKEDGHE